MDNQIEKVVLNLENDNLIENIVSRSVEEVNDRIVKREERRNKSFSIIVSVIAIFGLAGSVALAKFFIADAVKFELADRQADIEKQIESTTKNIEEEFSKFKNDLGVTSKKIEEQVALLNLRILTSALDDSTGFSLEQEKRVLSALRNVFRSENVFNDPTFVVILEEVITNFAQADRKKSINEIDNLYRRQLTDSPSVSAALCMHYGQINVASNASTVYDDDVVRFNAYCKSADESGYPEIALFWRTLDVFEKNNREQSLGVAKLINQREFLSDPDREQYDELLITFGDSKMWMLVSTPKSEQIALVVSSLIEKYPVLTKD